MSWLSKITCLLGPSPKQRSGEVEEPPRESSQPEESAEKTMDSQKAKPKRFEIEIYDQVSVGEPPYDKIQLQKVAYEQPVVITASGKADLEEFAAKLKLCNQCFKIVRVLGDADGDREEKPAPKPPQQSQTQSQQAQPQPSAQTAAQSPKYYQVGGVELKEEGGRIFERKWVALDSEEQKLVRIVSEKTGQPAKLQGKQLQVLRWTPVGSRKPDIRRAEDLDLSLYGEEV